MGIRIATMVMGLAVAGCAMAPSASPEPATPTPTGSAEAGSPSPSPTSTPLPEGTLPPSLAPGALDLDRYTWRMVVAVVDLENSLILGWWISVGTLAGIEPLWQGPVAIPGPIRENDFDDFPVVAGPESGRVLYVADDGHTSSVRAIDTLARTERLIVETSDTVVSARLAPDGRVAYLSLADRSKVDLGVFELRLDEPAAALARVMDAPSFDLSATPEPGETIHRGDRELRLSPDGYQLARRACSNSRGCALDILDTRTGHVTSYPGSTTTGSVGYPFLQELLAIGDGWVIGNVDCGEDSICDVESAMNLGSRAFLPISPTSGWDAVTVSEAGTLNYLSVMGNFEDSFGSYLLATDLHSLATRLVLVAEGSIWFDLYSYTPDLELELPDGWFFATLCPGEGVECPQAAVRLTDGRWVTITLPTVVARVKGRDF